MAGNGIIKSVSFTPSASGLIRIKCVYTCAGTGSDFGATRRTRCFMTQSGVTTYGDPYREGASTLPHSIQGDFQVLAYLPATFGLYCDNSGATSSIYTDISVSVELLKK